MPPFVFKAPSAYDYPASRDAKGVPLGTVQPGDVRDLDEAIDRWWVPEGTDESQHEAAGSGEQSGVPEGDAPEAAAESPAAAEASGPQPAPPAVIANP